MNKIFINKPGNTTMVIVATPNGAYTEPQYYKGISHFLEHMCFKGTKKRTQKEISASIDNIGGVLNAFTDWEITAYWAKVGNTYKNLAIDVITDLVENPIFPIKEVDKEREVIIQEMKMYEDNPSSYVWDIFNSALFSKESGFNISIIGTQETLKRINRSQIKKYHDSYEPILIVIGNVEDKIDIKNKYVEKFEYPRVNEDKKDKIVTRKNITQSHIVLGNYIYLGNYPWYIQRAIMSLLDACYSDMSGRLFNTIREKHNMVYGVHFNWDYYNKGIIWQVSAGLDKDKIEKARDLIVKELIRPLTKKELTTVLKKTIGTKEMIFDSVVNTANTIAYLVTKGLDYKEAIYNYEEHLNQSLKYVNKTIKQINFKDNVLAGVVPE